jgi:lipopolysaccharide export system permease protein
MFFIGAPLGAIIRKGGLGMPVVISIILFIIFWVLTITGEKISKEGTIPPYLGMWLSCAFFLPLGLWLTRKAAADAALFDTESYITFFKKIFIRKSANGSINDSSMTSNNDQNHSDHEGPSGM